MAKWVGTEHFAFAMRGFCSINASSPKTWPSFKTAITYSRDSENPALTLVMNGDLGERRFDLDGVSGWGTGDKDAWDLGVSG